jgi:hypothetical protein
MWFSNFNRQLAYIRSSPFAQSENPGSPSPRSTSYQPLVSPANRPVIPSHPSDPYANLLRESSGRKALSWEELDNLAFRMKKEGKLKWPGNLETMPRPEVSSGGGSRLSGSSRGGPLSAENASDRFFSNMEEGQAQAPDKRQQLMDLANALVAEENKELKLEHLPAILTAWEEAMKTGLDEDFEKARKCFFDLHVFTDDEIEEMFAGFEHGGDVVAERSALGNLIGLAPGIISTVAYCCAEKHSEEAKKYAIAGLLAAIGAPALSNIVNVYVYIHLMASMNFSFRNAPNIQPELATPQYSTIQKELNKLLATEPEIEKLFEEYKENPLQLTAEVDKLLKETLEKLDEGIHTKQVRAQVNNIFFEGLSGQASVSTAKTLFNLAGSWVGIATGVPLMSPAMQLLGYFAQVVGQYKVTGGDKVREQTEMIDAKIVSLMNPKIRAEINAYNNAGKGADIREHLSEDTVKKLKESMFGPMRTRATAAAAAFAGQTKELEQKISQHLGLDTPQQWSEYVTFKNSPGYAEYPGKLRALKSQREHVFNTLSEPGQNEILRLESDLASASKKRNHERVDELCGEIAGELGMPVDDYSEYSYLRAQAELSDKVLVQRMKLALDPAAREKYRQLEADWEKSRHDSRHVKERNFTEVSDYDMNDQKLIDFMQVSDSMLNGWSLTPEHAAAVKHDGRRRWLAPEEQMSNITGGNWNAYPFVIAGSAGSLMVQAALKLYEAHQQTKDPEYKLPLSTRAMATGLILGISAFNSRAEFHIFKAGIKPISKRLWRQIAWGSTGSGSTGTTTNWRMQLRTVLSALVNSGELAHVGWNHKQWPKYLLETVKASSQGLAALYLESRHAHAATSAADEAVAMRNRVSKRQKEYYRLEELRNDANAPQARSAGG